jgi:hypothetical protein
MGVHALRRFGERALAARPRGLLPVRAPPRHPGAVHVLCVHAAGVRRQQPLFRRAVARRAAGLRGWRGPPVRAREGDALGPDQRAVHRVAGPRLVHAAQRRLRGSRGVCPVAAADLSGNRDRGHCLEGDGAAALASPAGRTDHRAPRGGLCRCQHLRGSASVPRARLHPVQPGRVPRVGGGHGGRDPGRGLHGGRHRGAGRGRSHRPAQSAAACGAAGLHVHSHVVAERRAPVGRRDGAGTWQAAAGERDRRHAARATVRRGAPRCRERRPPARAEAGLCVRRRRVRRGRVGLRRQSVHGLGQRSRDRPPARGRQLQAGARGTAPVRGVRGTYAAAVRGPPGPSRGGGGAVC